MISISQFVDPVKALCYVICPLMLMMTTMMVDNDGDDDDDDDLEGKTKIKIGFNFTLDRPGKGSLFT